MPRGGRGELEEEEEEELKRSNKFAHTTRRRRQNAATTPPYIAFTQTDRCGFVAPLLLPPPPPPINTSGAVRVRWCLAQGHLEGEKPGDRTSNLPVARQPLLTY